MKNKSALITGASGNLGKSLVRVFAFNQYKLILQGRNVEKLESIRKSLVDSAEGTDVSIVEGDLRDDNTLERIVKKAYEKNISVLINNAAITCPGINFREYGNEQIKDMIRVNLVFPILLSRGVYGILRKNEGAIININSLAGIESKLTRTLYCASKGGLRGFSESLRMESEKEGVSIMDVYLSKMRGIEDSYGMNLKCIAYQIYKNFEDGTKRLIIDGRPKERITQWPDAVVIDGRKFDFSE